VPFDDAKWSAPLTLTYSYDDWAIGNIAHELGYEDEAKEYWRRSKFYKNVWNNKT